MKAQAELERRQTKAESGTNPKSSTSPNGISPLNNSANEQVRDMKVERNDLILSES
jgi:hypothetical protein